MKTAWIAAGALVCVAPGSAFAETPVVIDPPVVVNPPVVVPPGEPPRDLGAMAPLRAPNKALELGVEAGYTQGFGSSTSDARVGAGAGGTIGVSVDDRIHPRWSFGVRGQYQGYGSSGRLSSPASLRGVTADIHGTYHLSPYERLDPHVTIGTGYRLFVESPAGSAPSAFTHGLELGKVEVGLDVRPSESVAISPVIGADVDLFVWRTGGAGASPLGNTSVNAFVFAGVRGRFDVGGPREGKPVP